MRACPRCREPLPDDATFCYRCRWRETEAPRVPEPAPVRPQPPAEPSVSDPGGSAPRLAPRGLSVAAIPDDLLKPVELADEPERRRRRTPTRPARGLPGWATITIGVLAVGLAVSIGALVRTQVQPAPPVGTIVATAPIGPEGGVLPFGPGAFLEVPENAVGELTVFTVRRFGPEQGGSAAVLTVGGASYAFEPLNETFAVPVTIVFPLPSGQPPEVVVEGRGGSEKVRAFVDRAEDTISVRTRSFSDLAIAES